MKTVSISILVIFFLISCDTSLNFKTKKSEIKYYLNDEGLFENQMIIYRSDTVIKLIWDNGINTNIFIEFNNKTKEIIPCYNLRNLKYDFQYCDSLGENIGFFIYPEEQYFFQSKIKVKLVKLNDIDTLKVKILNVISGSYLTSSNIYKKEFSCDDTILMHEAKFTNYAQLDTVFMNVTLYGIFNPQFDVTKYYLLNNKQENMNFKDFEN